MARFKENEEVGTESGAGQPEGDGHAYVSASSRASRGSRSGGSRFNNQRPNKENQEDDKKRLLKRVAIIVGIALLVVIIIIATVLGFFLRGIDKELAMDELEAQDLKQELVEPVTPEQPYYVLMLGSDSRNPNNSGAGRSDTMILMRVDPETKKAAMVSIPRDTQIQLQGYGTQKINAAFAYGGPAGSVRVVSSLFDVQIAHYVEIDFDGLTSLVDTLGGVEVNVPVDIEYDGVYLSAGKQVLSGAQALTMARSRNFPDGDFTRVKHQRILVTAIAKAVLSADKLALPGLATELAKCVSSDVTALEAINMLMKLQGMDTGSDFTMTTLPSHSDNQGGVSYVVIEEEAFAAMREKFKAGQALE
ncbi:MAG TPA: LytR family transcriptional regulator [Coriobacteriia bacterium]|nr:LytR family transcriptional regulator [Coriobacteriia bacterium]